MKKLITLSLTTVAGLLLLTGCANDADIASQNLSTDADNFKVQRKVTFINTITREVLYTVEGIFSIVANTSDNQLEITAKTGNDEFQKHFLELSPTDAYIEEQLEWQEANKYNFKITINPSALIPEIEVR